MFEINYLKKKEKENYWSINEQKQFEKKKQKNSHQKY